MATIIQQLKGTAAEVAAKTYAVGVLVWNETTKRWHGGDGATAGGIAMARYDERNDGSFGYVQEVKTDNYAVVAADVGKMLVANKATAISFTLGTAASLGTSFVAAVKNIGAGVLTLAPSGANLIDGANSSISVPTGASLIIKGDGTEFRTYSNNIDTTSVAIHGAPAKTAVVDADEFGFWDSVSGVLRKITLANFWTQTKWRSRSIGEIIYVNTALTGVDIPPSSTTDTVWVELTAGLTGAGGFNNGKLTSESVSGSSPLVIATATVSLAGSPMNGQTISLLNTEGRILRPSTSPNTKQDDAMQGHIHGLPSRQAGVGFQSGSNSAPQESVAGATTGSPSTDGANGTPRTANETRMKNIGVKAYMRIA